MRLKAAVIGLGIGRVHAERLAKMGDIELVAVADINGPLGAQAAADYGVKAYGSGAELLAKERLDFVCICTNPATHFDLTRRAAQHGVHIFCEKPMAPTLAACDGMVEACRKAGVSLMIGQKKRFDPAYCLIKEKAGDEFGPVRWATIKYAIGRVRKPWFWVEGDGGGPLHENAVHMMDLMRFLIGEVERVYAVGGNFFNADYPDQIDVAVATLRFKNGAVAAIGAGQASEWGFATESVTLSHTNAVVEVYGPLDGPYRMRYVLKSAPSNVIEKDFAGFDPFAAELRHLVDCIRAGKEPCVPGEEGRASVALCLAVKRSVRIGRAVVL